MKKALKVNLGGQIFHIDEDAYDKFKLYLDTISRHFYKDSECKEIMADIEFRIAELFKGKMSNDSQVITIQEVNEIIGIMGRPEEIAADDQAEEQKSEKATRHDRRLYRDPDSRVFGGVCSGLAAYMNTDTVLVRIIFILLIFLGIGLSVIVYIVLWIAVPKAITPAQKLEMRGEKINVSNIERAVREEYDSVKDNIRRAKTSESYRKTESYFTKFFHVIGVLLLALLKIFLVFIAIIFIIVGISVLFGSLGFVFMGSSFLPLNITNNSDINLPDLIQPFFNPTNVYLFVLSLSLLVLIPIIVAIYGLFKVLFRFKGNDKVLGLAALSLWILALVSTFGLIYSEGKNFKDSKSVNIVSPLENINSDTLFVSMNTTLPEGWEESKHIIKKGSRNSRLIIQKSLNYSQFKINKELYIFNEDSKEIKGAVTIDVKRSTDKDFKIRINKTSRGKDRENSMKMADKISYSYTLKDNNLKLDSYFNLEEKSQWRLQKVQVLILVPEGKAIYLDNSTSQYLFDVDNVENIYDPEMAGHTWVMKPEGLSSKDFHSGRHFDH